MNRLPIEIENKIWSLYYSDIYYTNVISEFNTIIKFSKQIACGDIYRGCSQKKYVYEKCKFYYKELSKIYESEDLKRRIFQIYFYKKNT
jgi:hypothetical protein